MNVSVCIPTFNQANYIAKAVRSAFYQTYKPVEIIVSDDCSTDNTPMILDGLSREISILKVIRQPLNLGMNRNTDACLRLGTGEIIVKLDSDDYLAPTYLEKLAPLLIKFPDAGYAHAAVQEIDQWGNFTRLRKLIRKSGYQSSEKALRASINGYQVSANIIMFKRAALERAGFISSRTNFAEDFHLSASLAARGYGNVYLDEVLSYYRVWDNAGKARQRRKLDEIIGLRKVFEDVLEPAFLERQWNLKGLRKKRRVFASGHADCLGWTIYTEKEKQELRAELRKLSSHPKAKFFAWLHINRLGGGVILYKRVISISKSILKSLLVKFR